MLIYFKIKFYEDWVWKPNSKIELFVPSIGHQNAWANPWISGRLLKSLWVPKYRLGKIFSLEAFLEEGLLTILGCQDLSRRFQESTITPWTQSFCWVLRNLFHFSNVYYKISWCFQGLWKCNIGSNGLKINEVFFFFKVTKNNGIR